MMGGAHEDQASRSAGDGSSQRRGSGTVSCLSGKSRAGTAALAGPVTETMVLTGTTADNTVYWDFQVTSGRRSGVWSTIPTPSN